jgi:hypothetical protein
MKDPKLNFMFCCWQLEILLCHVAAKVYRCQGLELRPDQETTIL